jgi:hypothetical protein
MESELYKKRLEEDDGNRLDARTLSSAEEFGRSGLGYPHTDTSSRISKRGIKLC